MSTNKQFLWCVVLFELGLAAAAMLIGRFAHISPLATGLRDFGLATRFSEMAVGTVAVLPMLCGLAVVEILSWPSIIEVRRFLVKYIVPSFSQLSMAELALVAICAGIGEEALFRGLLQTWMMPLGTVPAIVLASALFGLMHPVTPLYVALAFLAGLYLGWLWHITGRILVPITTHAVYDFVALVWIVRLRPRHYAAETSPPNPPPDGLP